MKNFQTVLSAIVWKKQAFGGLREIQILKVTYVSYLDKVFENLTNKVQLFQRFKTFQFFWVFVLREICYLIRSKAILLSWVF